MLKPGGAETEGTLQMLQVSRHVSFIPAADSGRRGSGDRGGQGWVGEWILGRFKRVNTGGDETAQTPAGHHLFLLFIYFISFFSIFLDFKHKNHVLKKQPWC